MIHVYFKDSSNMNDIDDETVQLAHVEAGNVAFNINDMAIRDISNELAEELRTIPEHVIFNEVHPLVVWTGMEKPIREVIRILKPEGFLVAPVGSLLYGDYCLSNIANHFRGLRTIYPYVVANMILDHTDLNLLMDLHVIYNEPQQYSRTIHLSNYVEHFFVFSKNKYPKLEMVNALHVSARETFDKIFNYCTHEDALRYTINKFTKEGDWVLDPFAGSGTVGKVSGKLGRNCFLYEAMKDFYLIIQKRLEGLEVEYHCLEEK